MRARGLRWWPRAAGWCSRAARPPPASRPTPRRLIEKSIVATVTRPGADDGMVTELPAPVVVPPAGRGKPWTVRLEVPLEPGRNRIDLELANADGALRTPGSWTVTYKPPDP